ncbi:endonuclease/exonuclease/phosphatase family protein [Gymnodinialimonas sp. 2305UL16-5]|uniref:endonuclease/exonuclease/phosphatase family protein n=1 Tax=Gymnodinialimonas mytili TaxID=3126503 RepID=UPI0030B36BBF
MLASYLGGLHPAGDSLAVFRLWIAGGVLGLGVLLLALRLRRFGWGAILCAAIAAVPILAMGVEPQAAQAAAPSVAVYTKNTLGGRGDNAAILADIRASGADIVLLQELSATRGGFLAGLRATHPYQHECRFSDWSGMAVLSRWPLSAPYCSPHRSFAAALVEAPGGTFWAVSTHLVWPYPHGQAAVLDQAMPFLEQIEGRTVVAGDFNMVPWGHSVRRIARATGTDRIGALYETLSVRGVPLSIDHVFTDGTGTVVRRPRFGSDHYGLLARIHWEDAPAR